MYEGATRMYIGCAGLDTQILIDMFCKLFGEVDLEDADPKRFETKDVSAKWEAANKAIDETEKADEARAPTPVESEISLGSGSSSASTSGAKGKGV